MAVAVLALGSAARSPFPIGDWYGEGKSSVADIYSISHYKPDGTFFIEFRECYMKNFQQIIHMRMRDHIESGTWILSKIGLDEVTKNISGMAVHYTAQFKTISNDGQTWRSETVGGDVLRIFGHDIDTEVLVTSDSKLPGCNLTS